MNPNRVNISEQVIAVMKTVLLTGQRYGLNYLVIILTGREKFGLKDLSHKEFETFGALSKLHSRRVINIINYLLNEDLLCITNYHYGKIGITAKGIDFLNCPADLTVRPRDLRLSTYDNFLINELKRIRRELCDNESRPAFRVFTDYTLYRIVQKKPQTVAQLKKIAGIGDYKADKYGHLLLGAVQKMMTRKAEDNAMKQYMKHASAELGTVKSDFERGMRLKEIARKLKTSLEFVENCLRSLHREGEINLVEWIEQNIDNQKLFKAVEYFRQVDDPKINEAKSVLALDQETLRYCRLYATKY